MVNPDSKGLGAGAKMMQHAKKMSEGQSLDVIDIAASHLSEPFFTKFGARQRRLKHSLASARSVQTISSPA